MATIASPSHKPCSFLVSLNKHLSFTSTCNRNVSPNVNSLNCENKHSIIWDFSISNQIMYLWKKVLLENTFVAFFPHDLKILSLASKFKNIKRLFKQNVSLTFSFTLSCTTSAITAFVRELKVSVELLASEKNPNTTTLINLIFLCCNQLLRWNSLFIPYIVYLLVLIPWIMYKKKQEIKKVT